MKCVINRLVQLVVIATVASATVAGSPSFAHDDPHDRNHGESWLNRGRPIVIQPPRSSDRDEHEIHDLLSRHSRGLTCDRLGEMLRNLSNELYQQAAQESKYQAFLDRRRGPYRDSILRRGRGREFEQRRSSTFLLNMWNRLAQTYRQCDRNCFDDGFAVGQISATGYCQASIELGGLKSPGSQFQAPLPLCKNEISVGCQRGYRETSQSFPGCQEFASGAFDSVFTQSISQDCLMD